MNIGQALKAECIMLRTNKKKRRKITFSSITFSFGSEALHTQTHNESTIPGEDNRSVSYTHLDVYKRQPRSSFIDIQ